MGEGVRTEKIHVGACSGMENVLRVTLGLRTYGINAVHTFMYIFHTFAANTEHSLAILYKYFVKSIIRKLNLAKNICS